MINNRDRITSYTILPIRDIGSKLEIPWLQGCGAAEQPPSRVAAGILHSVKAGCISYFSFSSCPNLVFLWH